MPKPQASRSPAEELVPGASTATLLAAARDELLWLHNWSKMHGMADTRRLDRITALIGELDRAASETE